MAKAKYELTFTMKLMALVMLALALAPSEAANLQRLNQDLQAEDEAAAAVDANGQGALNFLRNLVLSHPQLFDKNGYDGFENQEAENVLRSLAARRRMMAMQRLQAPQRPKRRGSCMFHAGLAHNCDYKDLVGAVDEASHWGSDLAPGRRRR